ncbi:MAG: rhodanese-like domain-containing protein [Asgard group archaeon]|nr:rhodanese-like domain-containing protein [Asgard group archaeon]
MSGYNLKDLKLKILIIFLIPIIISPAIIRAGEYENITIHEAKERIDSHSGIFLLDVRSLNEYLEGHILGAININVYYFSAYDYLFPENLSAEIIVYCDNGYRSEIGAGKLVNNYNYSNVANMLGGINDWMAAGYPLTIGNTTETTTYNISNPVLPFLFISIISYFAIVNVLRKKKN